MIKTGIIGILVILAFLLFNFATTEAKRVIWYGTPIKISSSGDFRFARAEIGGTGLKSDWFFAVPADSNPANVDRVTSYLWKYPQETYKLIGVREGDDCGYYAGGFKPKACVPVMSFQSIELVKRFVK